MLSSQATCDGVRNRYRGLGEIVDVLEGRHTALYASAGADTMQFSFLSEPFLARRGVEMPAPDSYVCVDRSTNAGPLRFADDRTVIETVTNHAVRVARLPGWILDVRCRDLDDGKERVVPVLRIRAENTDVYGLCTTDGWTPETFIGVCDGCAFGGQRDGRCENSLVDPTMPLGSLPDVPRWWVSDHLRGAGRGSVHPGDVISHGEFPVGFRKLAILSSRWGHPWQPLFGATAFTLVRTPISCAA